MDLSTLPRTTKRGAKRVGRGIGSGKGGHTTGRGNKGQKARGKIGLTFEGTKVKKSFIKRLPMLRGKGKFKVWKIKPVAVQLMRLQDWPKKTEVTIPNLIKRGIVPDGTRMVKIIGNGGIKQAMTVKVATSKGACDAIKKAGGVCEA